MTLTLVALTALFRSAPTPTQSPDQTSVFQKLFDHATGANALEDYAKAADLLMAGDFEVYQRWLPPEKRPTPQEIYQRDEALAKLQATMTPEERRANSQGDFRETARKRDLEQQLNSYSFLGVKAAELDRLSDALALIESGTLKQVRLPSFDPTRSDESAGHSLGFVKNLNRLLTDAAYVSYAKGDPSRGTKYLLDGLVLNHQISSTDILAQLISIGSNAIILARFREHLGCLGYTEATTISSTCDQLLSDATPYAAMVQNERREIRGRIEAMSATLGGNNQSLPDSAPVDKQFRALSPDQQRALLQKVEDVIDADYQSIAQRLEGPEELWVVPKRNSTTPASEPNTMDQLVSGLEGQVDGSFLHDLTLAIEKSRTQLRLLRLHAKIIAFKWSAGRLPNDLAELKLTRDQSFDSLSKQPFQYEHQGLDYKLQSKGTSETGPIELKYRRPANLGPEHDPDRP